MKDPIETSLKVSIEGLETAFHGKLQPRQNTLIVGPPFSGKTTLGLQFIASGLKAGDKCVVITTNETAEGIKRRALEFGWDFEKHERTGDLKFIDCYSKIVGLSATSSHSVYFAGQDEKDLERLSIILSAIISDYWGSNANIRVFFDNLSSLFLYSDLLTVSRFLHVVLGRLKAVRATSMLALESGLHDEQTMTAIRSLCDGVVLLTNEGDTRFLHGTLGMGDFNKLPLRITPKGLETFEPAIARNSSEP